MRRTSRLVWAALLLPACFSEPNPVATTTGADTAASTGAPATTSSSGTSSAADTVSPGDESSDSGAQPAAGMYSHCLAPDQCPGLPICLTIEDAMMTPIDGFCTKDGCVDPGLDCDPSPGDIGVVSCVIVAGPGGDQSVCMIDCAGLGFCPDGMGCIQLAQGFFCF